MEYRKGIDRPGKGRVIAIRTLNRNKISLWYALYVGKEPILDEWGNRSGEYRLLYSLPLQIYANVSAARGSSDVDMFGIDTPYSKTIVTDDVSLLLDTSSILWVAVTPDNDGEDGAVKHNYEVATVGKSLNSITYAVREVKVS